MPLAIIAIHALQHLIQRTPLQGHFLTNKAPACKKNGRTGLLGFGQFVQAEAKLLVMGQQVGWLGPINSPQASTFLPGSRLSSESTRPPMRYPFPGACSSGELADQTPAHNQPRKISK